MQKQILLLIASLALFSGCDRNEKEPALLMQTPAKASTPSAAETQAPTQTSKQPTQLNMANPLPAVVSATEPDNLARGEKVYKGTCSICHKSGLNGAPRMGSKKDWELRLAQEKELLYSRAIKGYRGSKGSMPSRGSNPRLSDAEIKAAVDYMIEYSIPAWSVE